MLNIDTTIFVGFLIINLAVGLYYARGVKTAKEYAIGDCRFSTPSIIATIVATCMGAGIFSTSLSESYRQGLYFMIPMILGTFIALMTTGYLLAPRMSIFLGSQSVSDVMGKLYGKKVRIVTAISGVLLSVGTVALQLKAASTILQMLFDISEFYAMVSIAFVVTIYSSLGGIKAVTFTDIIQFFTFSTIIPLICIIMWFKTPLSTTEALRIISDHPMFDTSQILDLYNPKTLTAISLLFVLSIPGLDPAFFQRVLMSKSVLQAKNSFIIAGIIITIITMLICVTGVLIMVSDENLDPNKILAYIIDKHTYVGFKGLISICIMSIIMSTADSYINSATVLVSHDILEIDSKISNPKTGMLYLYLIAFSIGSLAFALAYNAVDMLSLLIKTFNFYAPVVSVSLLLTIFGLRSNPKVVLSGMGAAASVVILSEFFNNISGTTVGILGMIANFITFIIFRHFSKDSSDASKVYPNKAYQQQSLNYSSKNEVYNRIQTFIKEFNFVKFYEYNYSKAIRVDLIVGLIAITTSLMSVFFISKELQVNKLLYYSNLLFASLFVISPLLPELNSKQNYLKAFKIIAIPYTLVFTPIMLLILTDFSKVHLAILLVDLLAFVLFARWKLAISSLLICSLLSIMLSKLLQLTNIHNENIELLNLEITFIVSVLVIILIAFLKPKQEEQELTEEIAEHLSHELEYQYNMVSDLAKTKQTFIRNLQHETNTPVTGIYSMSQALNDCYDKLSDNDRKKAINTIMSSSERLISYVNNLVDVSKLSNLTKNLKIKKTNLSTVLEEVIRKCKKLYIPKDKEDDREITVNIEPNLYTNCDEYYIRKSYENIIINAIQYCREGTIDITLEKELSNIKLTVKDSGIGVPEGEHNKIFEPFEVSSKTLTPAGGRGMGLTLVKAVAEAHKGSVSVKSEGDSGVSKGSTFVFEVGVV